MKENKTRQASKKKKNARTKKKIPNTPKENKNYTRKQISAFPLLPAHHFFSHPGGSGGFSVSYNKPLCPISLTGKCTLLWVWSGSRPHWLPTRAPLGYPVTTQSLGDLAGVVSQGQSLHELQKIPDGVNARMGQTRPCCRVDFGSWFQRFQSSSAEFFVSGSVVSRNVMVTGHNEVRLLIIWLLEAKRKIDTACKGMSPLTYVFQFGHPYLKVSNNSQYATEIIKLLED